MNDENLMEIEDKLHKVFHESDGVSINSVSIFYTGYELFLESSPAFNKEDDEVMKISETPINRIFVVGVDPEGDWFSFRGKVLAAVELVRRELGKVYGRHAPIDDLHFSFSVNQVEVDQAVPILMRHSNSEGVSTVIKRMTNPTQM